MIYDRTILDVNNAKTIIAKFQALCDWSGITQAEIDTLERGTYTIVSLNRVEQKVEELATAFRSAGYSYTNPDVKTDWAYTDYFNKSQHQRFFENIEYLRGIQAVMQDTPNTPFISDGQYTYGNISYILANDAEKILYDINILTNYITSPLYYKAAGNVYSVAGNSNPFWRAAKINSPSVVINAYVKNLEAYSYTELSEDATTMALAVAEVQAQVDQIDIGSAMGTVVGVIYSSNVGQVGSLVFTVTVELSGASGSTGTLSVGVEEASVVPNVEMLDSIESDGVAYLLAGYYPQWGVTEVYAEITNMATRSVVARPTGTYDGSSSGVNAGCLRINNVNVWRPDWTGANTDAGYATVGEMVVHQVDATGAYVGGDFYERTVGIGDRQTVQFCIGGVSNTSDGSVTACADIKYGITKLGESGEWLRSLVPVRILATDEICMYDYVTQQYYKNVAGSGSFIGHSKDTPEYAYVEIEE